VIKHKILSFVSTKNILIVDARRFISISR